MMSALNQLFGRLVCLKRLMAVLVPESLRRTREGVEADGSPATA